MATKNKSRASVDSAQAAEAAMLSTRLREQLLSYKVFANQVNSLLKDANQMHAELNVDNKPINLVKGRLDRTYSEIGDHSSEEIRQLDAAIATIDQLLQLHPDNLIQPTLPNSAATAAAIAALSGGTGSASKSRRGSQMKRKLGANESSANPSPAGSLAGSPPPSTTSPILSHTAHHSKTAHNLNTSTSSGMVPSSSASSISSLHAAPAGFNTPSGKKGAAAKHRKEWFSHQLPLSSGRFVAFRMPNKPGEEKNEDWIWARVVNSISGDRNRYVVEDMDIDQTATADGGTKFNTTTKSIIPLPVRGDPNTYAEAEFKPGTPVLALYPGLTAFYRATIHSGPVAAPGQPAKKKDKDRIYFVKFEDDGDEIRQVAVEFVVEAL